MPEVLSRLDLDVGARVLVVDDDADVRQAAGLLLRRHGMRTLEADGPAAALSALALHAVDVVLLDLNFRRGATSGQEGLACLADLRAAAPAVQVVVVTAHSGVAMAVEAMRRGACDFVTKPWSNRRFVETLEAAAARAAATRAESSTTPAEGGVFLGDSAAAHRVRDLVRRAGPLSASVLVHGPAGAGKSLIACALHAATPAATTPFIEHDLGVGAIDVVLALEAPDLVLDSPEALTPATQNLLARRLADADAPRVICSSRLAPRVLRERLRGDLFYRLATLEIEAPPFAARASDAALLAAYWIALAARRYGVEPRALSPAAVDLAATHPWPDDARGLRQAVERALLLGGEGAITPEALLPPPPGEPPASDLNLRRSERAMIEAALARWGFNVSHAARELGLTRAALYRRMAKHGL